MQGSWREKPLAVEKGTRGQEGKEEGKEEKVKIALDKLELLCYIKNMKLKWESNSRVKRMASEGVIDGENIIERTTTDKFPPATATVRLANVRAKKPHVVVHIRGKSRQRIMSWNNQTYECADTCRVSLSNLWHGVDFGMSSNGELDKDLSWLDVHNVVERVKKAMEV